MTRRIIDMYFFVNDYSEGAHPKILEALVKTNYEQHPGYSEDEYCKEAKKLIKDHLKNEKSIVHFLVGGTQTNATVISAVLRPHQGVISAVTGHINVHESGAIENTGHKVIALPTDNGKITAEQVRQTVKAHYEDETAEHMVQPKMVYISQPTEIGTIYSKEELTALHNVCQEMNLILFADGARLGCALTSDKNDVTLADMAALTDIFYIGGTKLGALFGEAVVINEPKYAEDFRYIIKQKGGLFAKGRLLGVQFKTFFEDGLYFEIGKGENACAQKLQREIKNLGFDFIIESPTNQIFPIFPNSLLEKLKERFAYSFWQKIDDERSAIRLCTSWATTESKVDELVEYLKEIK